MNVYFGENALTQLSALTYNYDKFFLLTDENIFKIYSSMIASLIPEKEVNKIILPAGEQSKSLDNVVLIWSKLLEAKAGRDSLLINLGGGTISDIGGFAASCFKRGIDFINVPTTLLAMIDASIGGKNGINFNNYKNQIGLFSEPKSVIINPNFLKTLNERDILSGLAEMMKYAFIADTAFLNLNSDNYLDFIEKAAATKDEIVGLDMAAAKEAFAEFLNDTSLDSDQIYFVNQIVEYIVHNGMMKDLSVLQEAPFTDRGSVVELFTDLNIWAEIRKVIETINMNAAA